MDSSCSLYDWESQEVFGTIEQEIDEPLKRLKLEDSFMSFIRNTCMSSLVIVGAIKVNGHSVPLDKAWIAGGLIGAVIQGADYFKDRLKR